MAQHSLHGAEIERSLHGAGTNRNFHGVRSKRNQQLESALLTHTADQVSDSLRSVESFTSLPKKRLHIDLIPRMEVHQHQTKYTGWRWPRNGACFGAPRGRRNMQSGVGSVGGSDTSPRRSRIEHHSLTLSWRHGCLAVQCHFNVFSSVAVLAASPNLALDGMIKD